MAENPAPRAGRFVGRRRELATIAAIVSDVAEGGCRSIVVRGPAGIGKTTLCAEAMDRAADAGFVVAWGHGWPDGGAPPLWPWGTVLRALAGSDAASVLRGDEGRSDADRFARFSAVVDIVAARTATSPIAIVLDDAHLADTAALLLARFVLKGLTGAPVLVVIVRRGRGGTREVERRLDQLETDAAAVIDLAAFGEAETAALLRAEHPEPGVADELAVPLVQLTGGSPLLLARAARSPSLAGDLIEQALEALTPEHRDVLALAAILGSEGTTGELTTIGAGTYADVVDALAAAGACGLVTLSDRRWAFTHDVVRQAAAAVLTTSEAMEAHVRARDLAPFDDRAAAAVRRAHHALAAAERSPADAVAAIEACRSAARLLRRGFDYERAVALLVASVDLAERALDSRERLEVLLEWADALRVVGRLGDAREAYRRAVDVAEQVGDVTSRARAALGLGGVWVNEHRGAVDRPRVLALQRSALAELSPDRADLRVRLTVRLAAEDVYDGHPVDAVLAALEVARQLGDLPVLDEALSLTHHALLAPEHLPERTELARELLSVSASCGDDVGALFGLLWLAVDQFLAGDPRAGRTLGELRERTDAVGCRSIGYIVAAIDVMQSIRAGRLDDAEASAHECFELGVDVGEADATGYYGAHLLTIRWLQDRDDELLDLARDIAGSSMLIVPEFGYRAAVAAIAARAGRLEEATAELAALGEVAALPRSSTWLTGIAMVVEAAAVLGDADVARAAYPLLAPYVDRPVMPSLAIACFGSVERALGLAASTMGELDRAVDHLARAVEANGRLGNLPLVAIARGDLAAVLVRRGRGDDRERAIVTWRRAADDGEAMGMTRRAARWRRDADEAADHAEVTLRRDRGEWHLEVGGRSTVLGDLVGVGYLATLLARPAVDVSALELCGGVDVEVTSQPMIDADALRAYRRRVATIDEQLVVAQRGGPRAQVERLTRERDELRRELAAVVGRAGRTRRFVDPGERARTAVRKAIARALDLIEGIEPALAADLRATVSTGRTCTYRPGTGRCWRVVA